MGNRYRTIRILDSNHDFNHDSNNSMNAGMKFYIKVVIEQNDLIIGEPLNVPSDDPDCQSMYIRIRINTQSKNIKFLKKDKEGNHKVVQKEISKILDAQYADWVCLKINNTLYPMD